MVWVFRTSIYFFHNATCVFFMTYEVLGLRSVGLRHNHLALVFGLKTWIFWFKCNHVSLNHVMGISNFYIFFFLMHVWFFHDSWGFRATKCRTWPQSFSISISIKKVKKLVWMQPCICKSCHGYFELLHIFFLMPRVVFPRFMRL